MSKQMTIILVLGVTFALLLSVWTIFAGKGSTLNTAINRQPTKITPLKNEDNILHYSYKGLQGTQWSTSNSDFMKQITTQE